jgi:hypothetical protein
MFTCMVIPSPRGRAAAIPAMAKTFGVSVKRARYAETGALTRQDLLAKWRREYCTWGQSTTKRRHLMDEPRDSDAQARPVA